MTTKNAVRDLLDRPPDDCTLDDVLYHIYVLQAIDRGLADAEAARTMPHEQVAEEMRRKWVLGAAGWTGAMERAGNWTKQSAT